jgi:hypothetical protein
VCPGNHPNTVVTWRPISGQIQYQATLRMFSNTQWAFPLTTGNLARQTWQRISHLAWHLIGTIVRLPCWNMIPCDQSYEKSPVIKNAHFSPLQQPNRRGSQITSYAHAMDSTSTVLVNTSLIYQGWHNASYRMTSYGCTTSYQTKVTSLTSVGDP